MNRELTAKIKSQAYLQGFDNCAICKAEPIDTENKEALDSWVRSRCHADMDYMARNMDLRSDPTLLLQGAKSVIALTLNYYPHNFQDEANPQFAYYAYGKDYHEVIKKKLNSLYDYCLSLDPSINGRYFCDTAPLLERYWAAKAGIGWIGKNSLLIIPKKGSYFFLAFLILNVELEYDDLSEKKMPDCINCTRCIDSCPTGAIVAPRVIDARKCLSYQTIENKGNIDPDIIPKMNNRFYGCDICQQVCPWNRFASPHTTPEFYPSDEFLSLTADKIENMEVETYQRIFKGSAVKRAKLRGLKRNIEAIKQSRDEI